MSAKNWLTVTRYVTTAGIAGLSTAAAYYPHAPWIPVCISVLATFGIHLVGSTSNGNGNGNGH